LEVHRAARLFGRHAVVSSERCGALNPDQTPAPQQAQTSRPRGEREGRGRTPRRARTIMAARPLPVKPWVLMGLATWRFHQLGFRGGFGAGLGRVQGGVGAGLRRVYYCCCTLVALAADLAKARAAGPRRPSKAPDQRAVSNSGQDPVKRGRARL
jgi:hypothetical protein